MPQVSVIIPAYNASEFLLETLRSAAGQTLRDLEIIVVDDGSTDDTAELAHRFAREDPRVRVLEQANGGVAWARNHGIEASSGQFVAPLDADDLWSPDKLQRQVSRFEAGGDRVGLVYCWWMVVDREAKPVYPAYPWRVRGAGFDSLLRTNYVGCASIPMFRSGALSEVGLYDSGLRDRDAQGCEDWDLSLRIAERYEVDYVDDYLVRYRTFSDSMSCNTDRMRRSHEMVLSQTVARVPSIRGSVVRRSRSELLLYLAFVQLRTGDRAGAIGMAMKAWMMQPLLPLRGWLLGTAWRRLWYGFFPPPA